MLRRTLIAVFGPALLALPTFAQSVPEGEAEEPVYLAAQLFSEFTGVELNPVQQERFERIGRETVAKIQSIFDDDQKKRFKAALRAGNDLNGALSTIEMTDRQIIEVRSLVKSLFSEILYNLSRAQKLELAAKMRLRRNR